MLRVRRPALALGVLLAFLLGASAARAEDKVATLIALLDKKPGGMSDETWREKRRDAARELGKLADKRAVPPLVKIVETEKFDAVLEIAIESLGKLGDKRAVAPLRKLVADESRDRATRDLAADSLRALGEDPDAATIDKAPDPKEPEPVDVGTDTITPSGGEAEPAEDEADDGPVVVPDKSRFPDDVIAMTERWTLAVGSLALTYNSLREQPQLSGAATGLFRRGLEKKGYGYTVDVGLALAGGAQDRDSNMSDTASLAFSLVAASGAEMRVYLSEPGGVFGHMGGGLALGASAAIVETPGAGDLEQFRPSADLQFGLGLGYGRVIDVGSKLRLRRIEAVLRRGRLLGRPISADVAARIHTAWWELRSELGSLARLRATLQLLREAGVLLTDPDASTIYRLIRVLEDGQLDERLEGWDARIAFGETISGRDDVGTPDNFEWDREETLFVRSTFGRQLAASDSEIVGTLRGFIRLVETPRYFVVVADATWRKFFYGAGWDSRGALEIGAVLGASDLNRDDMEGPATRVGGRVGYVLYPNRASFLRISGNASLEGKELFFGVSVEGSYGFLSNSFAAW